MYVRPLVFLLAKVIARDVMPSGLSHREAGAANVMDFVSQRGVGDRSGYTL